MRSSYRGGRLALRAADRDDADFQNMSAAQRKPGRTQSIVGFVLVFGVALLALVWPMPAGARDRLLARDTHIGRALALDGVVVYFRQPAEFPWLQLKRPWMRIVNGRVSVARPMAPRREDEFVWATTIGLDRDGRVVVPFTRMRIVDDRAVPGVWRLYDVAANQSRPLRGLPRNLDQCSELSIWRSRLAYNTCRGTYLRIGSRTRKVPIPWGGGVGGELRLRGATLFGNHDDGGDYSSVLLLADASGFCKKVVPGLGFGDLEWLSGWWVTRGYLAWSIGRDETPAGLPLVGAKLQGRCRVPKSAGLLFTPPPQMGVMAVDDRFVYYGNATLIRRHRLPAQPSTSPPPNDNFEDATPLSSNLPLAITGVIGSATTQPGEPALPVSSYPARSATRTVWYAFRSTVTAPVTMETHGPDASVGVFTGSKLKSLTPLVTGIYPPRIDAVAGRTYRIAVGSASTFPDYSPFTLTVK